MWLGKVCLGVSYSCYSAWRQRSFVWCAEASWASQNTNTWLRLFWLRLTRTSFTPKNKKLFFIMTTEICKGKILSPSIRPIWLHFHNLSLPAILIQARTRTVSFQSKLKRRLMDHAPSSRGQLLSLGTSQGKSLLLYLENQPFWITQENFIFY